MVAISSSQICLPGFEFWCLFIEAMLGFEFWCSFIEAMLGFLQK